MCRATRDSGPLADWERGHGFQAPAGFFYELGVRDSNAPITAASQLGPAWWVTLNVRADGKVDGLVRQINRRRPAGTDLIAVPQPNLPRVEGVDVLDRFTIAPAADAPLLVDADLTRSGWRLRLHQGDATLVERHARWTASRHARIDDELAGDVYLWTHAGNFSGGTGTGTFQVALRD